MSYVGLKTNNDETLELIRQFGYNVDAIYYSAKFGTNSLLHFEKKYTTTLEGPALDCGIVTGDGFQIEKIDLYGDNPLYNYTDEIGKILLCLRCLPNSEIKVDKRPTTFANQLSTDNVARSYVVSATEFLNGVLDLNNKGEKVPRR